MTDILLAKFFKRGAAEGFTLRGNTAYACLSATGREVISGIGYGRITMPYRAYTELATANKPAIGDWAVVWSVAPDGETEQHITTFIIESAQYKDGVYELTGPDKIAELTEYPAVNDIGAATRVETTAESIGVWVNHVPDPDVNVPMKACYRLRVAETQDVTAAGKHTILFTTTTYAQEADIFYYVFADGEIFQTTIDAVNDRRDFIEIAAPLPQALPAEALCMFYTNRLKVGSATDLEVGQRVYYTPNNPEHVPPTPFPLIRSFVIDRIELGSGSDPDYIYSADPIPDDIAADSLIYQIIVSSPTTHDVDMLLGVSTFSQWRARRSTLATIGTTYTPEAETVFDVLLAISEMSGYQFRTELYNPHGYSSPYFSPWRFIEYFPPGFPITAGQVTNLGTSNNGSIQLSPAWGEILSFEVAEENQKVTHVIPYGGGGGSGRFDLNVYYGSSGVTLLNDYPGIVLGRQNNQAYLYNSNLASQRPVWEYKVFGHISPVAPETIPSRYEAVKQLTIAAAEYLLDAADSDVHYIAEVFTYGEPRPGDVIDVDYDDVEPGGVSIAEDDLIISEVEHRFDPDTPYRITRLTMSRRGRPRIDGNRKTANALQEIQRTLRHANFASDGDGQMSRSGVSWGGDSEVTSRSGSITLRAPIGNVTVRADTGNVIIQGQDIEIDGRITLTGDLYTETAIVYADADSPNDWAHRVVSIRGIPRAVIERRERDI